MARKARNSGDKTFKDLDIILYKHPDGPTEVHVPEIAVQPTNAPLITHEEAFAVYEEWERDANRRSREANTSTAVKGKGHSVTTGTCNMALMFRSAGMFAAQAKAKADPSITYTGVDMCKLLWDSWKAISAEERAIWQGKYHQKMTAYRAANPDYKFTCTGKQVKKKKQPHSGTGWDAVVECDAEDPAFMHYKLPRLDDDGLGLAIVFGNEGDSTLPITMPAAVAGRSQHETQAFSRYAIPSTSRVGGAPEFVAGSSQRARKDFVQGSSKRRAEDLPAYSSRVAARSSRSGSNSATKRRRTAAPSTVSGEYSDDIALFMPQGGQLSNPASSSPRQSPDSPILQGLLDPLPSPTSVTGPILTVPDVYRPQLQKCLPGPYPPPNNDFTFLPGKPSASSQLTRGGLPNIPYVDADLGDARNVKSSIPVLSREDSGSPASLASTVEETSPPPTVPGPKFSAASHQAIGDFLQYAETISTCNDVPLIAAEGDSPDVLSLGDSDAPTMPHEMVYASVEETATTLPLPLDPPETIGVSFAAREDDSFDPESVLALIAGTIGLVPRTADEINGS